MRRMFPYQPVRLAYVAVAAVALISMLGVTTSALTSTRPAYADHNSMYIVCPDPILEGNSGQVGIRRRGHRIVSATFFTQHEYYTAGPNDFQVYHGLNVEVKGGKKTLWAPIVTKEDTEPEHDETFAIGFWDGGVWHHCVVEIEDDDAPEITSVDIITSPVDGYAYRAGDSIDFAVNLDSEVDVEGKPLLSLCIGDEDDSTWRGARYLTGSGSQSLVFRYRVQREDRDDDGISVSTAAVGDDGDPAQGFSGNIHALGTDVQIDYTHPGVRGDWRQKVDGRPYVQNARITSAPPDGWDAYRANQMIEVAMTFDTDVEVDGEVTVDLYLGLDDYNWEEATRKAPYFNGTGTDTLLFGYNVRPGDMDAEGVGIIMGVEFDNRLAGFDGSGTIRAKGTDVERNPFYRGTGHQPEHKVDTEAPDISSVSITSRPAYGEAYDTGELVSVELVFSERVTITGDPRMELDVGGVARHATLLPAPERAFSNPIVFQYRVQEGDMDSDGIGIGANLLKLNGGGIYDSAGNAAYLSHATVTADAGQKVDTSL